MFSFVLDETDMIRINAGLAMTMSEERYTKRVFQRMVERPIIEKMIQDMDEDLSALYEIPISDITDELRRICPLFEDIQFRYSYLMAATYLRQRHDRNFKAIIILKLFFMKIRQPYLEWYYRPGGPGYLKAAACWALSSKGLPSPGLSFATTPSFLRLNYS